jgi:DNA polymerase-3 subunit epsilon
MLQRWRHARRCRRLARQCGQPQLRHYLESCSRLNIRHIANTPMIAVDMELTGLDKRKDHIIAMGWTLIDKGRIQMGSNQHMVISPEGSVGSSAVIHEMLDNEVERGVGIEDGLRALFRAGRGRVWVLHHAGLDIGFLKKACPPWAGVVPGFIVLDTLRIEYRRQLRRGKPVKPGELQLSAVRERYSLPRYKAHNALSDAFATAELMLAIAASMEPDGPLELKRHIKFF